MFAGKQAGFIELEVVVALSFFPLSSKASASVVLISCCHCRGVPVLLLVAGAFAAAAAAWKPAVKALLTILKLTFLKTVMVRMQDPCFYNIGHGHKNTFSCHETENFV